MNPGKILRSALIVVTTLAVCASAQAVGLFRAYLASDGSDSNPCTVVAPCRLLPAALAAVTDGGEIWMLDSANYNTAPVSVTKSVTILAVPGAVGSVVSNGGVAIDASAPGTSVALRNLLIVLFPGSGGTNGIFVNGAAKLTVEDSVISGHGSGGIVVLSQTAVRITNCIIRDNAGHGAEIRGGSTAEISGSKFLGNSGTGVVIFGASASPTIATISDSVLSANGFGLQVASISLATSSRASITRSTVSDNSATGINATSVTGATALATVGNNMVTGNNTGLAQTGVGSTLETLGNNIVRQNTTPTSGTMTPVSSL